MREAGRIRDEGRLGLGGGAGRETGEARELVEGWFWREDVEGWRAENRTVPMNFFERDAADHRGRLIGKWWWTKGGCS